MEKMILLLPGFISLNVAKRLGTGYSKIDSINYLTYTAFILAFTYIVVVTLDIHSIELQFLVATTISVLVGAIWSLYLSRWMTAIINSLHKQSGRNIRWENGSLLHHLFNDGKPHFIIVQKDSKDIAVGFYHATIDSDVAKQELSIIEYPEYRDEWELVKSGEKNSYLYNTKQTYINLSDNIIIRETEYPPEWA